MCIYPYNYFYLSSVSIQGQWNHVPHRLDVSPLSPNVPRLVSIRHHVSDATNNICFYFCAGLSPMLLFFKSCPMTNDWKAHSLMSFCRDKYFIIRRCFYSHQFLSLLFSIFMTNYLAWPIYFFNIHFFLFNPSQKKFAKISFCF